MKKLQLLSFLFILILMFNACGGSSEKEGPVEEQKEVKTEKADLKTKEGVLQTLKTIGFDMPNEFHFVKAELDNSEYESEFATDTIDTETFDKLNAWYLSEVEKFASNGWRKMMLRDNEEWAGSVINEAILYAPSKEVIKAMSVSVKSNKEEMVIQLYFSIHK